MLAKASLPDWITAAAAVVACYVAYNALVASTRAWVGPTEATATIAEDGTVTLKVSYKNAGKEPALKFGDDWSDDWAATIDPSKNNQPDLFFDACQSDGGLGRCSARAEKWQREKCWDRNVFQNRIALPDFPYQHVKTTGLKISPMDSNRIVVVQGCFVYKSDITLLPEHRTSFCHFYRVGQTDKVMQPCPVANDAS
ncbi:MAG: hypothetical protein QHD01_32060 [Bradyrhizobium sp.]|uniref:hypothetical protein n=1 Tax=Bradyrhizobium sp. TaxID=376 RepID=UPI0029BAC740|nr:hypothetical protein [Bradyrhizobium sp.]MDX3971205.1 hypothetical protein [Bradyrhizobium sp.]